MTLEIKFSCRGQTNRGLVRSVNQDTFLVNENYGIFIVADGMGGHAGGEIASKMCVNIICDEIKSRLLNLKKSEPQSYLTSELSDIVNKASTKIYEKSLEEPSLKGMGTTVSLLLVSQGNLGYIAHVGDSRLYLIRSGFIYQITEDHSLVAEQVKSGLITEEEAKYHQLRNVITRSVGYQENEYVDTSVIPLYKNDHIIICSDGLHGKVSSREISKYVHRHDIDAVDALTDLANERGGDDNITTVVIKIK